MDFLCKYLAEMQLNLSPHLPLQRLALLRQSPISRPGQHRPPGLRSVSRLFSFDFITMSSHFHSILFNTIHLLYMSVHFYSFPFVSIHFYSFLFVSKFKYNLTRRLHAELGGAPQHGLEHRTDPSAPRDHRRAPSGSEAIATEGTPTSASAA